MPLDYAWPLPFPISEAPIKPGVPYGPFLLSPGAHDQEWVVGEWDGSGWFSLGGRPLQPTHFYPPPPSRRLFAAMV